MERDPPEGKGIQPPALVRPSRATCKRMSSKRQLLDLQHLLENLPDSIPYCDINSTCYSFSISSDEIEEYGDETSAINHRLEVNFGSRHNTNGIVPIKEQGPGICAVVSALAKCSSTDARATLWIENLCSSAEKVYTEAGEKVRRYSFIM